MHVDRSSFELMVPAWRGSVRRRITAVMVLAWLSPEIEKKGDSQFRNVVPCRDVVRD